MLGSRQVSFFKIVVPKSNCDSFTQNSKHKTSTLKSSSPPTITIAFNIMSPLSSLFSVALLATGSGAFAPAATVSKVSSLSATASSSEDINRRSAIFTLAGLTVSPLFLPTLPASARLEGVNKPELLPTESGLNVIQVEKFLTKGMRCSMVLLLVPHSFGIHKQ